MVKSFLSWEVASAVSGEGEWMRGWHQSQIAGASRTRLPLSKSKFQIPGIDVAPQRDICWVVQESNPIKQIFFFSSSLLSLAVDYQLLPEVFHGSGTYLVAKIQVGL